MDAELGQLFPAPAKTPVNQDTPEVEGLRATFGLDRCRLRPFAHQVIGVQSLTTHPYFFLADEMGAGKTKQVIDSICWLYLAGKIKQVIVLCPASVRTVWFDRELGELAKHLWTSVNATIIEYHAKFRVWHWDGGKVVDSIAKGDRLKIYVTNYDFLRSGHEVEQQGRRKVHFFPNVEELSTYCDNETLVVLDESSAIKNHKALQSIATLQLRNKCGWVWLLNGTPIANSPLDLYAQGRVMNYHILSCEDFYVFRSRYAITTEEKGFTQVLRYVNLDDLQQRFAPYVLRRLKKDCLDLPEKLPPVNVTVPLKPKTWTVYKDMRDELCVWFERNAVTAASMAATKVLRLAQITSGFVGGVEKVVSDAELDAIEPPDYLFADLPPVEAPPITDVRAPSDLREVGREKLDAFLRWCKEHLDIEENLKILAWCRFRPELERLAREGETLHKFIQVGRIYGGQTAGERQTALRILNPRSMTAHVPALVVGTPQTGRTGLDLTAAHHVHYLSFDFSLFTRQQSEDRTHRPGQVADVNYYNWVATGPNGQKTIDHLALANLSGKASVADYTTSAWVRALREE